MGLCHVSLGIENIYFPFRRELVPTALDNCMGGAYKLVETVFVMKGCEVPDVRVNKSASLKTPIEG